MYHIRSTKNWRNKTLVNQLFQSFGEENVGKFTIANISYGTLVNLEFTWVKYWLMAFVSPNLPRFSSAKILHYTVLGL